MEQWIGSVYSKMAWRITFFFKFGVYRILEKSSSYIQYMYIYIYIYIYIYHGNMVLKISLHFSTLTLNILTFPQLMNFKQWDFWVLSTFLLIIIGFICRLNVCFNKNYLLGFYRGHVFGVRVRLRSLKNIYIHFFIHIHFIHDSFFGKKKNPKTVLLF